MSNAPLEETLSLLEQHAGAADAAASWPSDSWDTLRRGGVTGWCIPKQYGGLGWNARQLLDVNERLAGACLTTCFILSQRDAACRRLLMSGRDDLCRTLLPALASGERFATVGLSQLTTSRQHGAPAMRARAEKGAFVLDGVMPWVTGAARAEHFITGAALDDGRQILAVLPGDLPGVTVEPPLELMALQGSLTAEVRCANVVLDRHWLLAGPVEKVMASGGRGGAGGLETSCLALGLAGAAIDYMAREAISRPELSTTVGRLEQSRRAVLMQLRQLAEQNVPLESMAAASAKLRAEANALVLRATQAALTTSKGTGFLRQHPAQRWARQALFFLVWSCPRPAADALLEFLAPDGECPLDG